MVSPPDTAGSYNFATEATRFKKFFTEDPTNATTVALLEKDDFAAWFGAQPAAAQRWFKASGHDSHKSGRAFLVPALGDEDGVGLSTAAFCLEEEPSSPFSLCSLVDALPVGKYKFVSPTGGPLQHPDAAALSWAFSVYSLDRYKAKGKGDGAKRARRVLVWPQGCERDAVASSAASTYLVRDLISTPAEDCGPQHLEAVATDLAKQFGGQLRVVKGDDLLEDNYKMIHAVGRAAGEGREPRLLDLTWGDPAKPRLTLVGKGVCFDTGGLDIKPSANMLTMKKDMGGAAQVLGLARMIMAGVAPVRLRVLVAAVENSIAGNAFRPGDVLTARNGKTTEIGNTDAEGRLVLADCLVEASADDPDLIIDCATLTGAARVALGTDVPVLFCNNNAVANKLVSLSESVHDHVWRLPLWEGYRKQFASKLADIKNISAGGYGGAIIAALYLDEFVGRAPEAGAAATEKPAWVHLDFMAFNTASRPGKPEGGEAQGMRALHALVQERYGKPDHYPL